jgi:hypothetical protein
VTPPPSLPSNAKLKRAYLRYNDKYFNGQLPTTTIVRYADGREDYDYAESRHKRRKYGAWLYRENPQVITIGKWLRNQGLWYDIYTTLLHEMNHQFLGPRVDHGSKFKEGMRRLVLLGAFDDLL